MDSNEFNSHNSRMVTDLNDDENRQGQETAGKGVKTSLPIFSILDSIDFSTHFIIIGDVGTGKSTITPVHEFKLCNTTKQIIIREPSRASCNALFYSLQALHPQIKNELSVITKDTKINVDGKIKIVTDGVLLRMLAENSIYDSSIYFDESHQMSSQLELCLSIAKKEGSKTRNLFRIMSATIDPNEFVSFMGISKIYSLSGRRYPVSLEVESAKNFNEMFETLSTYLYSQPPDESWLIFLPTRRLVERYANSYGGVFIHGGIESSEINNIQQRAENEKNLKIFATNIIASSVNIYVDNVLIFNEMIDSKDKLGQKTLHYKKIDNNSLLQMIGRIGRFKPGRAVIISDTVIPTEINPISLRKSLETETPFDLVLLMSKYGLKLSELEFMSKVDHREVAFVENWFMDIGAIEHHRHKITWKGLLMSEIPYEPDFAHMISSALISSDQTMARFLLASGAFGDSLNHAYKSDMEGPARQFLYAYDKSNELNIKAHILKGYSEDDQGSFTSRLVANGIFTSFVKEALKNYESAIGSLNDLLISSNMEPIPREVVVDPELVKLRPYLEDCLSFEKFDQDEKNRYELRESLICIEDNFFARTLAINNKRILFDIVAMNLSKKRNRERMR